MTPRATSVLAQQSDGVLRSLPMVACSALSIPLTPLLPRAQAEHRQRGTGNTFPNVFSLKRRYVKQYRENMAVQKRLLVTLCCRGGGCGDHLCTTVCSSVDVWGNVYGHLFMQGFATYSQPPPRCLTFIENQKWWFFGREREAVGVRDPQPYCLTMMPQCADNSP